MRERKHLRCLGVFAIDEYKRRQIIRYRETAKLVGIKKATVVIHYDAATHNQNTKRVSLIDETPKCVGPGRHTATLLKVESKLMSNVRCGGSDITVQLCGTYECLRLFSHRTGKIAVPFLALLANVYGFEQVRTGTYGMPCGGRAEIRDRQALNRRFLEKKIA